MAFDSAPQAGGESDPYDMTSMTSPEVMKAGSKGDVDFDSIFAEGAEKFQGHTGESHGKDIAFDPNATGSFDTKRVLEKEDKGETLH